MDESSEPSGNNSRYSVMNCAKDASKLIVGPVYLLSGAASEFAAYNLGKELYTETEAGTRPINDYPPMEKAFLNGAEAALVIGGPVFAYLGYRVISDAVRSIYSGLKS